MGACFTVNLELTFLDEAAAVKAMQEYIHTANADFGLEKHKKRSFGTDKSEDLIKIFVFLPVMVDIRTLTEMEIKFLSVT